MSLALGNTSIWKTRWVTSVAPEQHEERFQLIIRTIVTTELPSNGMGFLRSSDHPITGYNQIEPEHLLSGGCR